MIQTAALVLLAVLAGACSSKPATAPAISGALVALFLGFAGFISGTDPATGQTVVTITNEPAVQRMIWSIFSIFPAIIALLIILLLKLYPIKK